MAIGDILEGLLAGAAGGFRGYSEFQQAEALRKEREAERNRLERIRKEDQAARAAEAAEARRFQLALAGFTPSTEAGAMGEPIAARAPELGRLLEEFGPTQIAAPGAIPAPRTRSDIASALAAETDGGRMDSGAMVAPNQTYSAIDRALAEADQPRPAPDRARVVMEQGPAPQALRGPSARERGMDFLEVDDRFYTRPGERMLAEEEAAREAKRLEDQQAAEKAENERLSGLIVRAASGDRDALSVALAEGLGPQVEAYRDFGKGDVREPTGKAGEIDYLINVLGYEPDEAVNYVLGRGPGMGGADKDLEELDDQMVRYIYDQANEIIKEAFGDQPLSARVRDYLRESGVEEGAPDTPLNRQRILDTVKREVLGVRKPPREPARYELPPLQLFTPGILSGTPRVPMLSGAQGAAPTGPPMSESERFLEMFNREPNNREPR